METKKDWKQKIINYEGKMYKMLSGIGIKVVNVRVRKEVIIADVKVYQDDVETIYRNCSYGKEYI